MLLLLLVVFIIVATQLEVGAVWLGIAATLLALALLYKCLELRIE